MRIKAPAFAAAVAAVALALFPPCAEADPVVVELFTSQGCSSCPDADRLVSTWGAKLFSEGRVLPLSFDVDYWNYLGWRDVFSAPAYSQRQAAYARTLGARTYTPQMVVAGRAAFVGSDAEAAADAVARFAGEKATARVSIEPVVSPASRALLRVKAAPLSPPSGEPRVMLALFENGLTTDVSSGENSGRSLRNDFVVRRLVDLGPLPPGGLSRAVDEAWDPAWRKDRGGAAVFIQDARTLAVTAARWTYPLAR